VTQQDFFERVLTVLETRGIPYMVTGSVGAMLYGEPRLTNDMDIVVDLAPDRVEDLARQFDPDEYYFPPVEIVLQAIAQRGQFNILHVRSGSKVDLIIKKEDAYSRESFGRRRKTAFTPRRDADSSSPEDLILSKLLFYRDGGSEKHLRDIRGILTVSGPALDIDYLNRWIRALGLEEAWADVRQDGESSPASR
jgi:hypothetical protein